MIQPKYLYHGGLMRVFVLVVLTLVILVAVFGVRLIDRPASSQAHESFDQGTLTLNKPVSKKISTSETHKFAIKLQSDHFFRIAGSAPGIALRASLFDPHGRELMRTACNFEGRVRVVGATGNSGAYYLEIEECDTEKVSASYNVVLEEDRVAAPSDANRVAAERAIAKAEDLRAELNIASNRCSVEKYQEALQLWTVIGDHSAQAAALRNIGEALQARGDRQAAQGYFDRALLQSRRGTELQEEIRVLNDLGYLQSVLGNHQRASELSSRALKLSRDLHDLPNEAQALRNTGEAYYDLGKLRPALEYEQQALTISRNLTDRRGQAQALLRRGYIKTSFGEVPEALADYLQALQLSRSVKDYHGQAFVLAAIGHIYSETGSKQEALGYYDQATALSQQIEDPFIRGEVSAGMGYVYYELGDLEKALWFKNQALTLYSQLSDRWGEAALHLSIGRIYHSMGEEQKALSQYQKGAEIISVLSNPQLESYLLSQTGEVYEQLGDKNKALANYTRALSLSRAGKNPRGEATVLNNIGHIHAAIGESREALKSFNQALPLTRAVSDRFAESVTLTNISRVERDERNLIAAKEKIELAIRLIESLRSSVVSAELRTSYFAKVRQSYEVYTDILMQLDREQPAQGHSYKALEISEQARARTLLETLNEAGEKIREGVDPLLLQKEKSLGQVLSVKTERHTQLVASNSNEEAQAVAREIDLLSKEYEEARSLIRIQSPHYAALTQPQPLTQSEIQRQLLDQNTLLLEYMLGDERSYVWVVTSTDVSSHELPGRAEIEKAARRYYELLTARQPRPAETFQEGQARVQQAAAQIARETADLSKLLLGPVADKLGARRLLIVPDGALQYIPFQALTMPANKSPNQSLASTESDEQIPLVLNHEIINEPSASTLALVLSESANRKSASKTVAVLADPVFDIADSRIKSNNTAPLQAAVTAPPTGEMTRALRDVGVDGGEIPRLFSSGEEADAIMSLVPWRTGFKAVGFDANRATAMGSNLAQYRVVHFATHALLDNEHPELSGILLSRVDAKGQQQDGFLRLHDIYNLKLPVDLVVLSACQTGLGKDVKGEGLIGLTRGFMYAGASGVVASLWKVDDEATAELMKHFYEGLFEKGMSPSAALRAAQLAMRQEKRWQEPYYWAGFVIQGQYAGNGPKGYQLTPAVKLAGLGLVALGLSLSVFFVLWQRRRRNL